MGVAYAGCIAQIGGTGGGAGGATGAAAGGYHVYDVIPITQSPAMSVTNAGSVVNAQIVASGIDANDPMTRVVWDDGRGNVAGAFGTFFDYSDAEEGNYTLTGTVYFASGAVYHRQRQIVIGPGGLDVGISFNVSQADYEYDKVVGQAFQRTDENGPVGTPISADGTPYVTQGALTLFPRPFDTFGDIDPSGGGGGDTVTAPALPDIPRYQALDTNGQIFDMDTGEDIRSFTVTNETGDTSMSFDGGATFILVLDRPGTRTWGTEEGLIDTTDIQVRRDTGRTDIVWEVAQ